MTIPPWLLLAMLIALTLSLLYQLISRHFGWRLFAYWVVVLAVFLGGELLAETVGWNFSRVGDLRLFPDLLASLLVLLVLWLKGA